MTRPEWLLLEPVFQELSTNRALRWVSESYLELDPSDTSREREIHLCTPTEAYQKTVGDQKIRKERGDVTKRHFSHIDYFSWSFFAFALLGIFVGFMSWSTVSGKLSMILGACTFILAIALAKAVVSYCRMFELNWQSLTDELIIYQWKHKNFIERLRSLLCYVGNIESGISYQEISERLKLIYANGIDYQIGGKPKSVCDDLLRKLYSQVRAVKIDELGEQNHLVGSNRQNRDSTKRDIKELHFILLCFGIINRTLCAVYDEVEEQIKEEELNTALAQSLQHHKDSGSELLKGVTITPPTVEMGVGKLGGI